jgi:hypothetical protein
MAIPANSIRWSQEVVCTSATGSIACLFMGTETSRERKPLNDTKVRVLRTQQKAEPSQNFAEED